ncbi:MAG: ATP-binding domain-containing protein [Calditrichaeota bacterium]|nr:ATP-binding domain-containing protein [Calditrichota bacterium]
MLKIINLPPRGISEQTLKILVNYQRLNEISLFQAMERCRFIALLSETQRQPVIKFVEQLTLVREVSQNLTLPELADRILTAFGLKKFFKNDQKRQFFHEKLLSRIKKFDGNLADFLEAVTLHRETDDYDPRAEKVSLMTLHTAKGLEFSVVFIAGCEEDLIPFRRKNDETADAAEERRLFYVGMTRAKRQLILLHARSRYLFGEHRSAKPSRFLNDIERALKAFKQAEIKDKPKKKSSPDSGGQIELF